MHRAQGRYDLFLEASQLLHYFAKMRMFAPWDVSPAKQWNANVANETLEIPGGKFVLDPTY